MVSEQEEDQNNASVGVILCVHGQPISLTANSLTFILRLTSVRTSLDAQAECIPITA